MSDQAEKSESGSTDEQTPQPAADDFARQAEEAPMGLVAEFWDFLKHEKKWWLTPIILVLLALAAIVMISPAAAPFIYPFF
ncbi:MAG: hypothetical protein HON53_07170 [Planctomycetaceae bacterium]|jgi:hypothetical protein|nr:hypothetical protein [Planctomycetaceae bacterium]MBT6156580.1 hypothetical protein [Planctomycetaceae bacterium]MBT6484831.1 hypothetical protein [Planctomycetaceae bacterium]MBT6496715.1 hypothetical protein [Planctomycetaceae bacterium]